jgi:hypothetical protein
MGSRPGRNPVFARMLRSLAVGCSVLVGGCVTVKPHERQYLAQPEMSPATEALEETFYSHIESAREGAFGGHGASGGGCGCG